jgi:hypothetical protein
MVRLKYVNTRKHRQGSEPDGADQGSDQHGQRSGSGSRTWPDANDAPPVYRVDLTHPVGNAEHGKAADIPPWLLRGRPTARPAIGRRHGEDRTSQSRSVMDRICPRRSGLSWQESLWNHFNWEKQMTSDARRLVRPNAGASRNAACYYGHTPVLPSCSVGVGCILMMLRFSSSGGSPRLRAAFERLEPCEGKLSRTVLRGV